MNGPRVDLPALKAASGNVTCCGSVSPLTCSDSKPGTNPGCASFLASYKDTVLSNGTEIREFTCIWYKNSVFSVPVHGIYSAKGPGSCDAEKRKSFYGIVNEVPSVPNCGKKV
mgnify:CR=1 FL=1